MTTTVKFYPIDVTFTVENNHTHVYLFGKTANNRSICAVDNSYLPYFYIQTDNELLVEEVSRIRIKEEEDLFYVITVKKQIKKDLGKAKTFYQIFVNRPKALKIISEAAKKKKLSVFEEDVPFLNKYLLDTNIVLFQLYELTGTEIKRNVKSDIILLKESITETEKKFLKPKVLAVDFIRLFNQDRKNNPFIVISFFSNDFQKTASFININSENFVKVKSEQDLLLEFKNTLDEYNPDIIVGYDSDNLLKNLYFRTKRYNLKLEIGLDYSSIKWNKPINKTKITGILHIDLKKFIAQAAYEGLEQEDYDTDFISRQLISQSGFGKEENLIELIHDKEKIREIISKSIEDSKLIFRLNQKLIPGLFELNFLTKSDPFNLSRNSYFEIIEAMLINQAKEFNEIIQKKPSIEEINKRAAKKKKQVFVFAAPGVYRNIGVFEINDLYPYFINKYNLSPDSINCECCAGGALGDVFWPCSKIKGFIPELIKKLENIKEKSMSNIISILINKVYDYLVMPNMRWYSEDILNAIEYYVKKHTENFINLLKKNNFEILFHDEEIIMFDVEDKKECRNLILQLDSPLKIKFFPSVLFLARKNQELSNRYILFSEKNKLITRGIDTSRNYAKIIRETQNKAIKMIFSGEKKISVLRYVKDIIKKLRNYEISLKDLVIETKLLKDIDKYEVNSPHVAAARLMLKKGYIVNKGLNVKYIVRKGNEKISERVMLPEDIKINDYDPDYYINNQLLSALTPIISVIGYDEIDIIRDKEQITLDGYF
ncbi:hypothetical protein JXB41_01935 [Candidatus Woesearchaeota archaeon]|nr:hypothetical protein [Candidatus Woesearchaeota archaeon]